MRSVHVASVVDLRNETAVQSFGELFLTAPYFAKRRVFKALVEGLAHTLGTPTQALYERIAARVGTEMSDFAPSVATFPVVSLGGHGKG